jgi:hypothetical protein
MSKTRSFLTTLAAIASLACHLSTAQAQGLQAGGSKLLLTGGVSSIDGAAGGGLVPWAVTGGYASEHEIGATAYVTRAVLRDYALTGYGVAGSWDDRVEVSYGHQDFDASVVVPDATLRLDIFGAKVRLMGDAILDSDTLVPQVAFGIESKHLSPGSAVGGVLDSVGARRHGIDYYLSATKLFLSQAVLVNVTVRASRANQNGLLGFGSADDRRYRFKPEASVAWLLRRDLAVGAEVRTQSNNLRFAGEAFRADTWRDVFVAWAPIKNVSLTAAWVDLGNIAGHDRQTGGYLSAQFAY